MAFFFFFFLIDDIPCVTHGVLEFTIHLLIFHMIIIPLITHQSRVNLINIKKKKKCQCNNERSRNIIMTYYYHKHHTLKYFMIINAIYYNNFFYHGWLHYRINRHGAMGGQGGALAPDKTV